MKIRGIVFLLIGTISLIGLYQLMTFKTDSQLTPEYKNEIEEFRAKSEERLRAPTGWLSVVGLHWLQPGVPETIGSASDNKITLAESTPAHLGEILYQNGKVQIRAATQKAG